jgi:hypothetical protein
MEPFDIVVSILPTLTEKQQQICREMLGIASACQKNGHKYKVLSNLPGSWFSKPKVKLYCEKCNSTRIEEVG